MNYFLSILLFISIYYYLRKNKAQKLFFLLIPLVLSSYFFGLISVDNLNKSGFFQIGDLVLVYIILFYLLIKKSIPQNTFIKKFKVITTIFLIFILFQFIYSIVIYLAPSSSFKIFRAFFKYFAILFFLRELIGLKKEQLIILINLIHYLTVIFGILYILNFGFGIKIFGTVSYVEENYLSTLVYRNFLAFPVFSYFIVSYVIMTKKNLLVVFSTILILLTDVLLVYTRSILAVFLGVIIVTLLIKIFLNKNTIKNFAYSIPVVISIYLFIILLQAIFPDQYYYFFNRIDEVNKVGSISYVSNAQLRINIIESRVDKVIATNPINGLGYLREDESGYYYPDLYVRAGDKTGSIIIGDQTWGNFIASNGFLGLLLLLIIIFYPIYYSLRNKKIKKIDNVFYCVNIALIAEVIIGFFSTNFNDDTIYKISFYAALNAYYIYSSLKENEIEKSFS